MEVEFAVPSLARGDGRAMFALMDRTTLDKNSAYAYLLFATHFAHESIVARRTDTGDMVGFVMSYRPPTHADTIFVWQIGVDPSAHGQGLGSRMLDALADRVQASTKHEGAGAAVCFMEATVTPGNAASRNLFTSFARRRGAELVLTEPHFSADDFPGADTGHDAHEAEDLFRIGPF